MGSTLIHTYFDVAWAVVIVLDLAGTVVIFKRKLWREIPAFATYFLFGMASEILGVILFRHPKAYYVFYWVGQAGIKTLNTWVVLEIYARLMRTFPALRKAAAWTLWSALVIGVIAGLLVWSFTPIPKSNPWSEHIELLGYSLKMLQLGLLLAVALIVRFFHLQLRRYYVFIAVGLAIVGLGDLSSYVLTSTFGYAKLNIINCINITINTVGIGLWTYVLLTGEPERPSTGAYAATSLEELRHWNAALSNLNRS